MIGIQLDSTSTDLKLIDGRLQVGTVDNQNQFLLTSLAKGSIKRLPARCVGAVYYLENEDKSGLLRETRKELVADGMRVASVVFDGEELQIGASYDS